MEVEVKTEEQPGLSRTDHPDIQREGDPAVTREGAGRKLIERVAADTGEMSDEDAAESLGFLLRAFHENLPEEDFQDRLWVNVGTPRKPKKILWVIRALERPEIRRIEESVSNSRDVQQGRGASPDLRYQTSLRIVTEGTVIPDLVAGARDIGLASPTDFLEEALKKKSGLVEQLAGEIYGLSGYDQTDVSDATEVKAAGK